MIILYIEDNRVKWFKWQYYCTIESTYDMPLQWDKYPFYPLDPHKNG